MVDGIRRRKILPTAHDLMKRISEEVSPVRLQGKKLAEQLMYQINRKKDGYVIALYNNGGLVWEKRWNFPSPPGSTRSWRSLRRSFPIRSWNVR